MTTNVTYRDVGAVVPISTTIKGAPLSNAEIDGNIKSLVDSVDAKVDSSDLAAPGGSALVGFKQDASGAIGRTVEDKLRESVSPEDVGGMGGGVADDTAAINNAAATARPLFLANSYKYTGADPVSKINYFGPGKVVDADGNPNPYFVQKVITSSFVSDLLSYIGLVNDDYTSDNGTRFYLMPRNTVTTGLGGGLKIFGDPYHLGTPNYRDLGIYFHRDQNGDVGTNNLGAFWINSKVSPGSYAGRYPDIAFSVQDGEAVGGRWSFLLANGSGGAATASIGGGAVTSIAVTDGGAGYKSAPMITISGGGGSGAVAKAVISNGMISAITMVSGGSGYSTAPNVTITPCTGALRAVFVLGGDVPRRSQTSAAIGMEIQKDAVLDVGKSIRLARANSSALDSALKNNEDGSFSITIAGLLAATFNADGTQSYGRAWNSKIVGISTGGGPGTVLTVSDGNLFSLVYPVATTITDLSGGKAGQEVTIICGNGNLTIANSATVKLAGGVNFVGTADDVITLVYSGSSWREKSRSIN